MGIEILPEIWPDWKVEGQIGEGAFGKVYRAVRNESDFTTYAAIKVITVPKSESEIESLQADGMSIVGAKSYLQGIVSDFINEIRLMESMKGTSNIVSVEDYKVVEKKDSIGWDIFIRMELLTPLVKSLAQNKFTEKDVIKLGIDICSALELCAHSNVVHRDIKPENIFVSSHGNYKIGDFGIARQLEKTSTALSSKGTFNYIAPEVAKGLKYDARVDIYSLGIVLYKLLNNNRLPFIDPNKEQLSYEDKKLAVDRRLSGERLPAPVNASEKMARVIDMACRYNPEERFSGPTAMKNALTRLLNQSSPNQFTSNVPVTRDAQTVRLPQPAQVKRAVTKPTATYNPANTQAQNGNTVKQPVAPQSAMHNQQNPVNSQRNNAVAQNYSQSVLSHGQPARPVPLNTSQSNGNFNPMVNINGKKNGGDGSGRGLTIAIILIAVIAIIIIVVACTALAGDNGDVHVDATKGTTATGEVITEATTQTPVTQNSSDVVEPDFYYTVPLYCYVDVDDQYDGDPLRMRTGPGKDGTEKIMEIPDGNSVYVYGGLSDNTEWVYVEFEGNYGWVLSKYLH